MDENEEAKLKIIMKDYEILKTYSTSTSPGIRYNLISVALATVGIVISGTMIAVASGNLFNGNQPDIIIKLLAALWILFIPSSSITVLYIWIGEEERMMRVGMYCQELESGINKRIGEEILNWENFKRKKSIIYPEILIIAIFLGLSLSFSLAGLYLIYRFSIIINNFLVATFIDICIHLLIAIFTYLFARKRLVSIEGKKNNNNSCQDNK